MNYRNKYKMIIRNSIIIILCFNVTTCTKPTFESPFDPKYDPDKWAPTDISYNIINKTVIQLSWSDNSKYENGYKIDRRLENNDWVNEYGIVGKNETNWFDVDTETCFIEYKIYAYAGNVVSSSIQTNKINNYLFMETFGGNEDEYANSVKQTIDGGYIISGYTISYGAGSKDFWLLKTAANGNEEWNQTFGGSSVDEAHSVQQTTDGGFIVAGVTRSFGAGSTDFWLIKTDTNGNEEWNQTFGGSSEDVAYSVQQTTDGGFIVAGETKSYGAGSSDFWLVKTDANGNEEWNQTFGLVGSRYDIAYSVQQTTDGGFIVAGRNEGDYWLIKTDTNGNEEWNQTFGGSSFDVAYSVQQTTDGGFIVAGRKDVELSNKDFLLIKTDEEGNTLPIGSDKRNFKSKQSEKEKCINKSNIGDTQ